MTYIEPRKVNRSLKMADAAQLIQLTKSLEKATVDLDLSYSLDILQALSEVVLSKALIEKYKVGTLVHKLKKTIKKDTGELETKLIKMCDELLGNFKSIVQELPSQQESSSGGLTLKLKKQVKPATSSASETLSQQRTKVNAYINTLLPLPNVLLCIFYMYRLLIYLKISSQ